MTSLEPSLIIDIPVKLADVLTVFSIGALVFLKAIFRRRCFIYSSLPMISPVGEPGQM